MRVRLRPGKRNQCLTMRRERVRRVRMAAGTGVLLALLGGCDFGTPNRELPSPRFECFRLHDPYALPGTWHRANLHMHTTHSDGLMRAEEMIDLYSRNGYTLLCLSDHNQYGDQDGGILPQYQVDDVLHDWNGDGFLHPRHVFGSGVEAYVRDYSAPAPPWSRDAWYLPRELDSDAAPVVLPGAEVSLIGWHLGIVGIPSGPLERPGRAQGVVQRAHDAGGFVFLAHPSEWNGIPGHLARKLRIGALDGIEILNGLRLAATGRAKADLGGSHSFAANFPADATPLWDRLLARGYRLWGLANDDAHSYEGATEAYPFTAFDMVLTGDPTPRSFMTALHAGSFYASTGLLFGELGTRGNSVVVSAPGATRLRFLGWGGRVLLEVEGERGVYAATGVEGYVRVEAEGAMAAGRSWSARAWSQPFYLEPGRCSGGLRHDTHD